MTSSGRFEIGPLPAVLEDQRARAAGSQDASWDRLFYGHFCLKIDGRDFGRTEHALRVTYELLEAINTIVFQGKENASVSFFESVHSIGLCVQARTDMLVVSQADHPDRVFDQPEEESAPVPLRAFAAAIYKCHVGLCDQAVRMYPGRFTHANRATIPYSDHLI